MSSLNEDAEQRRREGYVGMDSTLAEIIAKRAAPPPNLEYLKYGDATTYGQSYAFSEEMLAAVGGNDKKPAKGTLGRTSFADGGAPWAFVPKELEEPVVSLYGTDFVRHKRLNPLDKEPISAQEIMRRRKREIARKREEAREAQELERQRIREEERQKRYQPKVQGAVVKVFSHSGVERRCISAPPEVPDEALSPIAHSTKSIPMIAQTTTMHNPLTGGETGLATGKLEPGKDLRAMYPAERQRLKFAMLEAARLGVGKHVLRENGWAESTEQGGKEKRYGHPERDHHLSPEECAKIEDELQRLKALDAARKEAKKAREQAMLQEAERAVRRASGSEDQHLEHGEATPQPQKATLCKPIAPSFRPELPGAVPHGDIPLRAQTSIFSSPPPWGRQTALDDKWQKVRVYKSRSKAKVFEPVEKLEVDRELRIVRDQGLMKRERRSLLKTMDPRQIQYIKSLPADFGKESRKAPAAAASKPVAAVKPMKPAASIASAYLK